MATKVKEHRREIPEVIVDQRSKKRYSRGRFLGKGGFAKCYELTDLDTNAIYAGKIVSKGLLGKKHQKDKMAQEIDIQRSLNHPNVVHFHGFFEDEDNVYVILELCRRCSLMEMHKRRKAISEPETRYFLKQIATACKYLHENNIIHRDLKLGNLFLNDDMQLKVGDFGLATRVSYVGERKKTLCGTPNYIAPEILNKNGHSFEVDIWSLGCIMFTLLVGKPPFEMETLKDTYSCIKQNKYQIPSRLSSNAQSLIRRMLVLDPMKRPSVDDVLRDDFMTSGYLPSRLPTSCLTTAPRFDQNAEFSMIQSPRKPLMEVNTKGAAVTTIATAVGPSAVVKKDANLAIKQERPQTQKVEPPAIEKEDGKKDNVVEHNLKELFQQITAVLNSKPSERQNIQEGFSENNSPLDFVVVHACTNVDLSDEAEDPSAAPMLWVSKWVDYSDKYGLGYQLCDNSVGVLFNDCTKLLLLADGDNIHYIMKDGCEQYHTLKQYPNSLNKKVTLLSYFHSYMNEHLLKAGASMIPRDGDELARLPYLRYWFRTRSAIILHLTNGTLQINFFQDHTKLILCPLMNAVTYIDEKKEFRTFRLRKIAEHGCSRTLAQRLHYAQAMVEKLLTMVKSSTK